MDDFFKQAAEEYLNALSNSLPQPEDCKHSFGKRFEKQMRHLIVKTVHPVRVAMLRAAASFAAALLLFGSVLAIDVDARKAFFGWVAAHFGTYIHFSSEQITSNAEQAKYTLGWVPDGYHFEDAFEDVPGFFEILYTNDAGDYFRFSYSSSDTQRDLFVMFRDQYDTKTVLINNQPGTLYLPRNKADGIELIWQNTAGTLFELSGNCEESELILAAESAQKIK